MRKNKTERDKKLEERREAVQNGNPHKHIDKWFADRGSVFNWWLNRPYDWSFDLDSCPESVKVVIVDFFDRQLYVVKKDAEGNFPAASFGSHKVLCWRYYE